MLMGTQQPVTQPVLAGHCDGSTLVPGPQGVKPLQTGTAGVPASAVQSAVSGPFLLVGLGAAFGD